MVAGAFILCLVGAFLLGLLLCRRTKFGRQFWRLAGPFFTPRRGDRASWKPLLTALLVLALTVLGVRIDVIISNNNNRLFTALQELDQRDLLAGDPLLLVVAAVSVVLTLVGYLIGQLQVIRWRQWTNAQVLTDWLSGTAYHRARFIDDPIDNPEQRIQSDVDSFTDTSQTLVFGLISSMLGAGLLLDDPVEPLRPAGPLRPHGPAGADLHRLHLHRGLDRDRHPDRPAR